MAEKEQSADHEAGLSIANELIEFANDKREEGHHPLVVASALRHAAANFTAFAFHGAGEALDGTGVLEDFSRFLAFYDDHHRQRLQPMTDLEKLAKQVENE